MNNETLHTLYRKMYLIRRFEESVLDLFGKGKVRGTTHTYIGQEATAVALTSFLSSDDILVSHHRSHGHFLSRFEEPYLLYAEILGKKTGVCGGRGGSQHLCYRNFYSSGILGGTSALAAGIALAEKKRKSGAVVVLFATDGMLGEGIFYEVLNMISLWQLPVLVLVENNRYAQSTPIQLGVSGKIVNRGKAFDMETAEFETFDVLKLIEFFGQIVPIVKEGRPFFAVVHCYRFGPHSKGDDFRDPGEIEIYRKQDPLLILELHMDRASVQEIRRQVDTFLHEAREKALSDPPATLEESPVERIGLAEYRKTVTSL